MKKAVWIGLVVLLAGSIVAGILLGSARLSLADVIAVLTGRRTDRTIAVILYSLRLPRVAAALLAGAGLAVAGLLLQSATDNDLCSPNVIGVNAGAGFAVMVCLCLFPMAFQLLPVLAFVGALATTMLVLGMSFTSRRFEVKTTVILAGVAVGTLFNAGIAFLSQLYPDILLSYSTFSAGGFSEIYAKDLIVPGIMIGIGILCAQLLAGKLNLLCLGDELAQSLGVRVRLVRLAALVLASALCAAVVSFAGLLGFVGLMVPHIARRLVGRDIRILTPACSLAGASLVILSDLAARTLFSPAELPAGILMAALGAPFFLYLLFRRRSWG